ncbi:MAG: hypothetical protein HY321_06215 [Armatimonadetes bacterium]|nr:hypothetical protein [Armatimonadota bacterium]
MRRPHSILLALLAGTAAPAGVPGLSGVPARAARGSDAIDRLVAAVSVGEASRYRNLTLFPVRLRRTQDDTPYVTLDEALKRGSLVITELASADVNRVRVRNRSSDYVFLLAGEIIAGAKQDRMVEDDLLLPPHSPEIALGVFCTEQGRWSGRSTTFEASGVAVHNRLRQVAKESRSQSRVWEEVTEKAGSLRAARPETSAARRVYSQSEVQSRARPYADNLEGFARRYPDTVGVVAVAGGEIIVADVFCNPSLFRKLWPKLLESYVLDAIDRSDASGRVDRYEAERFLENARRAAIVERSTPGTGDLYDLRASRVYGSALVRRDAVVHIDLFPRLGDVITPRPSGTPDLDFRRRQQEQRR